MKCLWFITVIIIYVSTSADGACEYPSDLRGEWYTTSNGEVTFNNDSISNFKSDVYNSPQTYNCEYIDNSRYITRARISILTTTSYDVYFCMSFTKITSTKYLVFYNADIATFVNERVVGKTVSPVSSSLLSASEACNLTESIPMGTQELIIKKGYESTNRINCPSTVTSNFDMTINDNTCTGNVLNGMSYPTQLHYSYNTSCASVQYTFTDSGNLSCMYSVAVGSSTYLTVFNEDSSTDESTTYRFICYVISYGNQLVQMTYHPKICQYNQTSVYVTSPGVVASLVDQYADTTSNDGMSLGVIVTLGVVAAAVVFVIGITFLVYYINKIKHQKQKINYERKLETRISWVQQERFTVSTPPPITIIPEKAHSNSNAEVQNKPKKKKKLHEEENKEPDPKSSRNESRRRSVWWEDCANFDKTIEENQEPPVWQQRWEMFQDPLNMKQGEDMNNSKPDTSRSTASVSKVWINPEQTEIDSVWERVTKRLTPGSRNNSKTDALQGFIH